MCPPQIAGEDFFGCVVYEIQDIGGRGLSIRTPIISVDGDSIMVPIGMKEEVDQMSKFEVLEVVQYANGMMVYRRVGVVRPVENMIWDNRYMAAEEQADGATLMTTTFRAVSGSNFYPGMLIREIK